MGCLLCLLAWVDICGYYLVLIYDVYVVIFLCDDAILVCAVVSLGSNSVDIFCVLVLFVGCLFTWLNTLLGCCWLLFASLMILCVFNCWCLFWVDCLLGWLIELFA